VIGWLPRQETKIDVSAVQPALTADPFEWGLDWLPPMSRPSARSVDLHDLIRASYWATANSDQFFTHDTPACFEIHQRELRFVSPVSCPYPENATARARWYPARRANRRAVLILPHWNARPGSYAVLCRILNALGYSVLLLTLPYHGARRPEGCRGAEYAVSPNLGRTIATARQTVLEVRCCLDWLEQQGYRRFGMIGTSLGSGFGFLASAHDRRIEVNVFNHCCATISDVVWQGLPRLRRVLEPHVTGDELRSAGARFTRTPTSRRCRDIQRHRCWSWAATIRSSPGPSYAK
jgi:dienelactone hydrolase